MALPDGMTSCTGCVELMTGTVWVDVSDNISVVDAPTSSRDRGSAFVFGEDTAVISVGKRQPIEVTFRGVFAEGTADPFYTAYAAHTASCGNLFALRWSPGGCTTANDAFYTSTTLSEIPDLTPPGMDAGSSDILMWEATVYSPDFTRAAWA